MEAAEKRTLDQKLLEFQTAIEVIKKDGKNEFFKKPNGKASSYATLPNILSEVKPILNALKILITQPIREGAVFTILTDTESGEKEESSIALSASLSAQQAGSAITYFRRYTLCSLLALEIDDDDDGNAASGNTKAVQKEQPKSVIKPDLKTNTSFFKQAVKFIIDGGTIEGIEANYNLSPQVKQALVDAAI